MDNKENLLTSSTLQPLDNIPYSRRKRVAQEESCELSKLNAINRQLRQQLESFIRKQVQGSDIDVLRRELIQKQDENVQYQQQLEYTHEQNDKLQDQVSELKRVTHEIKAELSAKINILTVKEKQYQNLLSRSKDQNSRIVELETYKLKYDSIKDKHSKLEIARMHEMDQKNAKMTSNEIENQNKHLKVSLSDCQFELKRLIEDCATYKTLAEMDKVKVNKEYEAKLSALKKHLEEENENWIKRFELRDSQFRKEVESVKSKYGMDRHLFEQTLRSQMAELKKRIESQRQQQVSSLQREWQEQRNRLIAERQSTLYTIKVDYEGRLEEMKSSYEKLLEKKKKQYESHLCSVNAERKTEEGLHEKTKQEMSFLKTKLYDEIYNIRKQKSLLEDQLKRANTTISELEKTIKEQQYMFKEAQKSYESAIQSLNNDHSTNLKETKQEMKRELDRILSDQLSQTDGLSVQLKEIESTSQQQEEFYQRQVDQLSTYFEERPSRQQDLRTIQELENKLYKKQNDIELLSKELKWHRLELQNKQDTYNRIFTNGIHEVRIPTQHLYPTGTLKLQQARDFKFRKIGKNLSQQREYKTQDNGGQPNLKNTSKQH